MYKKLAILGIAIASFMFLIGYAFPANALVNIDANQFKGQVVPKAEGTGYYAAGTVTYVVATSGVIEWVVMSSAVTTTMGTITIYDQASTSLQSGNIKAVLYQDYTNGGSKFYDFSKSPMVFKYGITIKMNSADLNVSLKYQNAQEAHKAAAPF